MSKAKTPKQGTCIAVNFRNIDSTGNSTSVERCHGIIESIGAEGYVIAFGGVREGQRYVIPLTAEIRRAPGGHFYFPDSDEWVAPVFYHEVKLMVRN